MFGPDPGPSNQWPTTVCPLSVPTSTADSTAFLSVIDLSKVIESGIPTPAVEPFRGVW